uniref:Cysteine-rich receptor-like protein kinase 2 n=1 Tax=Kalanchoe fedtschenkoi TaxID=63787 RepID=A0A7N0TEN5_KALFE
MKKSTTLLVLILVFLILSLAGSAWCDPRAQIIEIQCGRQREHNSTLFVPNFVSTMEAISDQMRVSGFGKAVTGAGPDGNYGLAQCYGDLSLLDCVLCYAQARTVLPKCFPNNSGRVFLDGCFMRSANYSFFEEYEGDENDKEVCGNVTRKAGSRFRSTAETAIAQAVSDARHRRGYARTELPVPGSANASVYVLTDCWRSLNASSCSACLSSAAKSVRRCLPKSEGRALFTGCFIRYSDVDFLNDEPRSTGSREILLVLLVSVLSGVFLLVMGVLIGVYVYKHRVIQKKRRGSNDVEKLAKILHDSSLNFKYSTIVKATGYFDEGYKLGQGGFGTVYKGVLADGREIAVKRLFYNNRHRAADFYNEVNIISRMEHKNLVRLLGCCCSGPESLLVYEYLPNKSLDRFIFDASRGKALTWDKRYEVILGTAEGLVYLHENTNIRIIHRDIKASNILLDTKLRAKIADFGLARSFEEDKSHISTAIAGTLGYMAPEYLAHGQLTEKADVYSFGVLMLEVVSGRQNNRGKATEYSDSLVIQAWKLFQRGAVEELFDPNLLLHNYHDSNVKAEVSRAVHIGLLCTQESSTLRPLMSKVLEMLRRKNEELPAPANPPFVDEGTMSFNDTSENQSYHFRYPESVASVSHSSFYPR